MFYSEIKNKNCIMYEKKKTRSINLDEKQKSGKNHVDMDTKN